MNTFLKIFIIVIKNLYIKLNFSSSGVPLVDPDPLDHSLNLTVIHINDIHAYFEETNRNSARCRPDTGKQLNNEFLTLF